MTEFEDTFCDQCDAPLEVGQVGLCEDCAPEVFEYYINLDERGEFYADVRDHNGETILEIHNGDDLREVYGMKHKHDLEPLENWLIAADLMTGRGKLRRGN